MERKEIFEKVAKIVQKQAMSDDEITETMQFDSLGFDSLDAVEVVMDCEKEFEISIPDTESNMIRSVGELVSVIENNL